MLAIQPMCDEFAFAVKIVQDPVGVIRHRCGEDNDLVVFGQLLEEPHGCRPEQVVARILDLCVDGLIYLVVNQCLVKIKYERVYPIQAADSIGLRSQRWKVRNGHQSLQFLVFSVDLCLLCVFNI